MKNIFIALCVLVILGFVYLMVLNFNNYAGIIYLAEKPVLAVRLSTFIFLTLLGGIFVGAGTVYMFLDVAKDKVKAYQRELEKTAITGSNNASRVEVLEAKIKTLEKAFNTVIDQRTQLEVQIKSLNAELDNINRNK